MARAEHVLHVRLTEGEWLAFMSLCACNRLSKQDFLHAIIIDALVDEGYDALRRREQERHSCCGETGESRGDPAT